MCRDQELPYVPIMERMTDDQPTGRITFPPAVQATDRMTDRIRAAAGGPPEPPPVEFGPVWDRMVNLITEHRYQPVPRFILGPAKWNQVYGRADAEDRAILETMLSTGQIIVSSTLPDPEVAYRYVPRADDGLGPIR